MLTRYVKLNNVCEREWNLVLWCMNKALTDYTNQEACKFLLFHVFTIMDYLPWPIPTTGSHTDPFPNPWLHCLELAYWASAGRYAGLVIKNHRRMFELALLPTVFTLAFTVSQHHHVYSPIYMCNFNPGWNHNPPTYILNVGQDCSDSFVAVAL